jgi:hypothetical protein
MSHCGQRSASEASALRRVIRQQKADMNVGPEWLTGGPGLKGTRPQSIATPLLQQAMYGGLIPMTIKRQASTAIEMTVTLSRAVRRRIAKKHRLKNRFSLTFSNGANL